MHFVLIPTTNLQKSVRAVQYFESPKGCVSKAAPQSTHKSEICMTPALLLYISLARLCENVLAFKKKFLDVFGFFEVHMTRTTIVQYMCVDKT